MEKGDVGITSFTIGTKYCLDALWLRTVIWVSPSEQTRFYRFRESRATDKSFRFVAELAAKITIDHSSFLQWGGEPLRAYQCLKCWLVQNVPSRT